MPHTLRPRLRGSFLSCVLTVGSFTLLVTGCAGTPAPATSIHQDARVAVFLQTVSDKSFRAAHPLKLDEKTMENVLRGVHAEKKAEISLFIGKALKNYVPDDVRAFPEDDIAVLTPHITAALAQAAPNQRVLFQLHYATVLSGSPPKPGAPGRETTEGYLFADGLSLHLTLTEFGPGKVYTGDAKAEPRVLPDPTGLHNREVKFTPEAAMRPGSGRFGGNEDHTVAIDYQLMTKLLAAPPQPAPAAAPAAGQPRQPVPIPAVPAATSNPDLQAFKEQLKAMQKKLDEQNAELQELKKSSTKKK
ncbi:MAG: hypothetical protein ACT4O4_00915 [Nitrospiraceae bacterium]